MKKRSIKALCILLAMGLLAGCGAKPAETPKDKTDNGSNTTEEGNQTPDPAKKEESDTSDSQLPDTDTPDEEEKDPVKPSGTSIEEQTLLEQDGLKISAAEWVEDEEGSGIKLLAENTSGKDLTLKCNALIVNNYMIPTRFSSSVAAGEKAAETLYISSSELQAAEIDSIGQIELYFHVYDAYNYLTVFDSDCVTIKTSEYDSMDVKVLDDGKELLNQDGIKIIGKYVDENSSWGTAVLLYIENKSGKNIGIDCDTLSVNGFMVTPIFTSEVYNDKMAVAGITIVSSDLEDNGIEKVEEVEMQFEIYELGTFSPIINTDPLSFSAK